MDVKVLFDKLNIIDSVKDDFTVKVALDEDVFSVKVVSASPSEKKMYAKADAIENSASGSIASFHDGANGVPMNSLIANIVPIQDLNGYSHPWPVGGGVNLFNKDDYTYINDCYIGTSALSYGSGRVVVYIPCSPITNYTVSRKRTSSNERFSIGYTKELPAIGVAVYGIRAAATSGTVGEKMSLTTTTDADALYLVAWAWWGATDVDEAKNSMQIEVGSSATTYSPYSNICPITGRPGLNVYVSPTQDPDDATVYNVDWSTQAGTVYGGTVDVVTGVLMVDRAMVDMGDLAWFYDTTTHPMWPFFRTVISERKAGWNNFINSVYQLTASQYDRTGDKVITGVPYYSGENIIVRDTSYTDATTFKTAVTGQQLVYELATPITYQLTPKEVKSLLGQNNVWSDGGTSSVTYRADTKLYIDNKITQAIAAALNS